MSVEHRAELAQGGLSQDTTYETLCRLARRVSKDLAIVELGTYRGASARALAAGAQAGHGAHVWSVDPQDLPGERSTTGTGPRPRRPIDYTNPRHHQAAVALLAEHGLTEAVTFIRGFSQHVGRTWTGPRVGLLYVDGDHREGAVRQDYAAWEPHLAPGAVVAWDDHKTNFPGVVAVVNRLVHEKGLITEPIMVGSLAVTARC